MFPASAVRSGDFRNNSKRFMVIGKLFNKAKFTEIDQIYRKLKEQFKDNFYIEIQRHNDENEKSFESFNLNLSKIMQNKEKSVSVLTKGIEFLFKKNKVTYIKGTASLKSNNEVVVKENNKNTVYGTKNIIISTGSLPVSLPGIDFDEKRIVSSTGALSLKTIPKKMVIVGGGYIGLEMGSIWARLGSEIHVIEFLDHIIPGMDLDISKEFQKVLTKQGIKFLLETKVDRIVKQKNSVKVFTSGKNKKEICFSGCNSFIEFSAALNAAL